MAERPIEQQLRAIERRRGVVDPQRQRAHRGAMGDVEGMRETLALGVDDQVDVALLPARHRLRLVLAGVPKTNAAEQALKRRRGRLVDRELDELNAAAM